MKRLFDPLFLVYCLVWIVVHVCRQLHQPLPMLNDHLTDFIAVPTMAHLTLTFTRRWIVRDRRYTYPMGYCLFIACYVSVILEWVMPHISSKFTGDWLDVAAYFGGGLFFYCFHNKPGREVVAFDGFMPRRRVDRH
jgi:hypothetical protein